MTPGTASEFHICPIGRVKSTLTPDDLKPGAISDPEQRKQAHLEYLKKIQDTVVQIELFAEHEERLHGVEGFSHLQIVFWPHLIDEQRRRDLRKVHPRGIQEIPQQGIFATRSPVRPNPLLITVVRLVRREALTLYINGLDCLDGTPVIDIKPMISLDPPPGAFRVPEWVKNLNQ